MKFIWVFFFLIPIAHNPKCVSLSEDVAISRRLLKVSHLKLIEIRFGEDGVRKSIWNGCELWKQIPHWLAFSLICSCVNKESTGGKWKLLQCCWKVRSAVEEPHDSDLSRTSSCYTTGSMSNTLDAYNKVNKVYLLIPCDAHDQLLAFNQCCLSTLVVAAP